MPIVITPSAAVALAILASGGLLLGVAFLVVARRLERPGDSR